MNERVIEVLKRVIAAAAFVFFFALVILGRSPIGWGRVGMAAIGLTGLLTMLYLYNRKQRGGQVKPTKSRGATVPSTNKPASLGSNLSYLANVRPSPRQLQWQSTEFYAFIHFGTNTFTDREWGDGTEPATTFNPTDLDVNQWLTGIKDAGMRGVILTAKHHDGFCLWPTKYTDYSVKASPWRGGKGDLVAEVAKAARRLGLKFGVYLSPWDRHESSYGTGREYDDFYVGQLTELLTGYGEVFSVWLDGANGEGPSGKRQVYDWDRYYQVVRSLQPNAVINVSGPDVRWCGNEAGDTRDNEWSVVPAGLRDVERIAEKSQQIDDGEFSRKLRSDEEDLGSRAYLANAATDPVWYPAEVNTSIRPGWFYHESEDGEVRSPAELFDIYCGSVGGNATFLLNLPPDKRGLLADADLKSLRGLGELIRDFYGRQATAAGIESSAGTIPGTIGKDHEGFSWDLVSSDKDARICVSLPENTRIEAVVVGEDISRGQRIECLLVDVYDGAEWHEVASCEAVGYRRILRFGPQVAQQVRVRIPKMRLCAHVNDLRVIEAK